MKSRFICPYCFETINTRDVQFRCINNLCPVCDDEEMTRYERGNPSMPKKGRRTFPHKGLGAPKSAACPACRTVSYTRICPRCHNELPESTLSGEDFIISVVGARGSGKSHYVGVIIYELMRRISVSFGGCIEDFSDSRQRWEQGFMRKLYMERKKLPLTQSSLYNVNNGAYRPLIFQFRISPQGKNKAKSITLVFFDTAGEDLRDERIMDEVNKYICKSSGIIFLLDPTQIPYVAQNLDKETLQAAQGSANTNEAIGITSRTASVIRRSNGIPGGKKIKIPVAVVFSKLDIIEPLLPPELVLLNPSPHCAKGAFVRQDAENVKANTETVLTRWGMDAFLRSVDTDYSDYSLFTMSALGMHNNPRGNDDIDIPRPHRIEDALLWLLSKNGFIPSI